MQMLHLTIYKKICCKADVPGRGNYTVFPGFNLRASHKQSDCTIMDLV